MSKEYEVTVVLTKTIEVKADSEAEARQMAVDWLEARHTIADFSILEVRDCEEVEE